MNDSTDTALITGKLSNTDTFIKQANLSGLKKYAFLLKVNWIKYQTNLKLKAAIKKGICYYGPFKGEFGHMTAHTAPFLMYLHKKGVKIIYCGMELHKPLLVDSEGKSIIHDFRPLRDFFHEVMPRTNVTRPPQDVQQQIDLFIDEAKASGLPFFNIDDDFYYWFVHRNWLPEGHTYLYDLEKAYKTESINAACIFPRSKGARSSKNNGEAWDYEELIEKIKPYFDKIYVTGHPSQVLAIKPSDKVELCITADNAKILEKCANSNLIITQHSGVNNLGEYTNTKVLIIYKGGSTINDIGSIQNTLYFRPSIGTKHSLSFAFTEDEITDFVNKHTQKYKNEH